MRRRDFFAVFLMYYISAQAVSGIIGMFYGFTAWLLWQPVFILISLMTVAITVGGKNK